MKSIDLKLQPRLFRAGAGTGKTTCLVNEVYGLFKSFRGDGRAPPRLIVCTFTRKAGQELKERLFKKAEVELLTGEESMKSRESGASSFVSYVRSPFLHISTIDSLLSCFLKKYGGEINLSSDFQSLSADSGARLFESLSEEFLFEKHFSLLRKIPYPVLKQLLLLYFSCRLAYGEIKFYDEADFKDFAKEKELFLKAESLDILSKPRGRPRDWDAIRNHFSGSAIAEFLHADEDIEDCKKKFKEEACFQAENFVPLFKEFQKAGEEFVSDFLEKKKKSNILDANDLLLLSMELLRKSPRVAKAFASEWDYWLIDEYQDTSRLQEQIISHITGFKNVFCVGDPRQSIYLFRKADPNVFKRREKALQGKVQNLNINYRSTPELAAFYNDFFPESDGFLKIKPDPKKPTNPYKACAHFITYKRESKGRQTEALKALSCYIQKLVNEEGAACSDIAILSSQNDHLEEIAEYMREQKIPVLLHSSKNFAEKRLILDALFLLKFLVNPYDNDNLKALLRTPYFYLPDQELADSCFDHSHINKDQPARTSGNQELSKSPEAKSFWSFIKEKFADRPFIQPLNFYLNLKKEKGLIRAFESALRDSGLQDLSYFQDSTGSSEANLWKFLDRLDKEQDPLKTFYSLIEPLEGEDVESEAPACGGEKAIELMTIHKSKGLEFKHVILMDFSLHKSSSRSETAKSEFIYDEEKKKAAFAAPVGGRDKPKVKSYGHAIYNERAKRALSEEQDRLYYVAMTRAKQSLAVFISTEPADEKDKKKKPEKNSWLHRRRAFFNLDWAFAPQFEKNFLQSGGRAGLEADWPRCGPMEEEFNDKKELKAWRLKEGYYKAASYSFFVKASEKLFSESQKDREADSFKVLKARPDESKGFASQAFQEAESRSGAAEEEAKGSAPKSFQTGLKALKPSPLRLSSSEDFIKFAESFNEVLRKKAKGSFNQAASHLEDQSSSKLYKSGGFVNQKIQSSKEAPPFNFSIAENTLFKTGLGSLFHELMHQLSFHSLDHIQSSLQSSFLSKLEQEKMLKALSYAANLKAPPLARLLKKGFAEYPFKLKNRNAILQGRVDLWAWDQGGLYIFDYKSSKPPSSKEFFLSKTGLQLIFYGWALNKIHRPKNIYLCGVYPFDEKFIKADFRPEHQELMEAWLNQVEEG